MLPRGMPFRRERAAPVLSFADPLDLWRYFEDLEFLFLKHGISDEQEKKQAAVYYTSVKTEQTWSSEDTFEDSAASYETFKARIIACYPDTKAALHPSFSDFEKFVADQARTPIHLPLELGEYYREFRRISQSLIDRGHFSPGYEARRLFASFEPHFADAVHTRLMHRFPERHPDDLYVTKDVYEAALYVLALQRDTACQLAEKSPPIARPSIPMVSTLPHSAPCAAQGPALQLGNSEPMSPKQSKYDEVPLVTVIATHGPAALSEKAENLPAIARVSISNPAPLILTPHAASLTGTTPPSDPTTPSVNTPFVISDLADLKAANKSPSDDALGKAKPVQPIDSISDPKSDSPKVPPPTLLEVQPPSVIKAISVRPRWPQSIFTRPIPIRPLQRQLVRQLSQRQFQPLPLNTAVFTNQSSESPSDAEKPTNQREGFTLQLLYRPRKPPDVSYDSPCPPCELGTSLPRISLVPTIAFIINFVYAALVALAQRQVRPSSPPFVLAFALTFAVVFLGSPSLAFTLVRDFVSLVSPLLCEAPLLCCVALVLHCAPPPHSLSSSIEKRRRAQNEAWAAHSRTVLHGSTQRCPHPLTFDFIVVLEHYPASLTQPTNKHRVAVLQLLWCPRKAPNIARISCTN